MVVPYYYCEAATANGRIHKKILKASDKKHADTKIRDSGLRPMWIEDYHVVKKKRQEALHKRHIMRDTLLAVAGVSLIGGIAAYFIVLDVTSSSRLDIQQLARSGIVSQTPGIINAETQEEREFAREARRALEASFPDSFGGITIERKFLMIIYIKNRKQFADEELDSIVSIMTASLYRRFGASNCRVFLVHGKRGKVETIAEGEFVRGEVKVSFY